MAYEDFDIDSLAKYLHITPAQVTKLADRGNLPGRKVGGQWVFSQHEIHHWLEDRIGASDDVELVEVEHDRRRGHAVSGAIGVVGNAIPERLEFLAIMQREAERVLELIRGLLELSTIESGGVALDRARVSLNTVVRECLLLLKPRLDERALQADCLLDQTMPLVLLDPNRIKQVILNLVDNAVKFAPAGSTIQIRTEAGPEVIRLVVRNASESLEEADLARIFERFVQRDGTFARQHGGVGLGLNLVRAIVELHGGRVWAELCGDAEVQLWAELPVDPS